MTRISVVRRALAGDGDVRRVGEAPVKHLACRFCCASVLAQLCRVLSRRGAALGSGPRSAGPYMHRESKSDRGSPDTTGEHIVRPSAFITAASLCPIPSMRLVKHGTGLGETPGAFRAGAKKRGNAECLPPPSASEKQTTANEAKRASLVRIALELLSALVPI